MSFNDIISALGKTVSSLLSKDAKIKKDIINASEREQTTNTDNIEKSDETAVSLQPQEKTDDLPEPIKSHYRAAEILNVFNENTKRPKRVYYPNIKSPEKVFVKNIELSEEEAVRLGWSFRKKSKSIRITNYHGKETKVIVPYKIDGIKVNEIGDQCFAATDVEDVEMPSGVAKIGNDIFNRKIIKRVIFSDSIRFIPDKIFAFANCLYEVHLPYHLNVIGKAAFSHCGALKYIALPDHLINIEEKAFCGSGLEGFSFNIEKRRPIYKNPFYCFRDGSAFYATPLQNKYRMILLPTKEDNTFIVLTVGIRSDIVFNDDSKVYMAKKSVNTTCKLNFSHCRSVEFFQPVFNQDKDPFGVYQTQYFCRVEGVGTEYAFPLFVDTYNRQGDSYNGTYKMTRDNSGRCATFDIYGKNLLPFSLEMGVENITLLPKDSRELGIIHKYAIDEKELKNIDLGDFKGIDEIFSPICSKLQYVTWNEYSYRGVQSKKEKYIPPSDILGENISYNWTGRCIHQILLQAFRYAPEQPEAYYRYSSSAYRAGHFFDQTVIDQMFISGQIKSHGGTIPLKRKDKILIAIDILRSTRLTYSYKSKGCQEERDMYEKYLRNNIHCAERVCNKVYDKYPEYAEFLMRFTEQIKCGS